MQVHHSFPRPHVAFGRLAVLISTLCFYFSIVVIRWSKTEVELHPAFFVVGRLALGLLVVAASFAFQRKAPRPSKVPLLVGRALFNVAAVFSLFASTSLISAAQANTLNLTYPVWVAIFSYLFLKSGRDLGAFAATLVAFAGIVLVSDFAFSGLNLGGLWGIISGITAAVAVLFLNAARKYNDTDTVLLFMFGIGCPVSLVFFNSILYLPNPVEAKYILACAAFGVAGQYLITIGYRFVTAVEGSIISASSILFAALLGPYLTSDPPLTVYGWLGASIIFLSNVYVACRGPRLGKMPSEGGASNVY